MSRESQQTAPEPVPTRCEDARVDPDLVVTERLRLPVLDATILEALAHDPTQVTTFSVPAGWPDDDDVDHVERWRRLAIEDGGRSVWRARAVVAEHDRFVGHAGFHGPPVPIESALADPTFIGSVDPCDLGAVEIGYTILAAFRGNGYATEAVRGLLGWARSTGEVGAVIACVRTDNAASLAVLDRLGGFEQVGRCRDGDDDELVFRHDLSRRVRQRLP